MMMWRSQSTPRRRKFPSQANVRSTFHLRLERRNLRPSCSGAFVRFLQCANLRNRFDVIKGTNYYSRCTLVLQKKINQI
jgi:hypothetical protein